MTFDDDEEKVLPIAFIEGADGAEKIGGWFLFEKVTFRFFFSSEFLTSFEGAIVEFEEELAVSEVRDSFVFDDADEIDNDEDDVTVSIEKVLRLFELENL